MYLGHYQTMKMSFEQICQGEQPWVALGNFRNDWYAYHPDERERLVIDPLPETYPHEYHRWAVFCAASARWFCSTYEIPCPSWVDDTRYILPEPWYMSTPPSLWQHARETTPEEFVRHNIFCGNRVYKNKYEVDERGRPLKAHPVDLQERRVLVRAAAARAKRDREELECRMLEDTHLQTMIAHRNTLRKRKGTTLVD